MSKNECTGGQVTHTHTQSRIWTPIVGHFWAENFMIVKAEVTRDEFSEGMKALGTRLKARIPYISFHKMRSRCNYSSKNV